MSAGQTRAGSCLCEANKFTVKGDPIYFSVCHCTNCKKQSGTAFMSNVAFKEENVDLAGSQSLGQYTDTKIRSGLIIHRHFCNRCGSSMFIKPDPRNMKGVWVIPSALIDGFDDWTPSKEDFPENRCSFVKALEFNFPEVRYTTT
ncbi:hypothetical protein K435DRAFT_757802 [Dendrothele bispora CBS 962.96]|uniref:CENP-V/GFA domain-containing protein n=1 Tax=Dendrothele bispora (strain CBS 962.96) TaxID=1314807 RepID=A0A4S8LUD2_DENBC|nr:hypothetical protein K435DRAFT_757802 [Dendrothele bispora CBS 962.96]